MGNPVTRRDHLIMGRVGHCAALFSEGGNGFSVAGQKSVINNNNNNYKLWVRE